jgi:hypothetical protein
MPHPHHSRFGNQSSPIKPSFPSHASESSSPTQNDFRLSRQQHAPRSASTPQEATSSSLSRSSSRSSLSLDLHDMRPSSSILGTRSGDLDSPYGGAIDESSYTDSFSPSLYLYDHDSPYSRAQTPTGINEPLPPTITRRSPAASQSLYDPFFSPPSALGSTNPPRSVSLSDRGASSYISSRLVASRPSGPSQFLSYRTNSPEPPSPTESNASSDSSFSSSSIPPPFVPSPRSSALPISRHYNSSQCFPDLASNLSQTTSRSSADTASTDSASSGPHSSPVSPTSSLPPTPTMLEPLTSPSKETYAESVRRHTRAMMAQAGGDLMKSPERAGGPGGLGVNPGPSPRPRKQAEQAMRGALYRGTMVYQADQEVEPTY